MFIKYNFYFDLINIRLYINDFYFDLKIYYTFITPPLNNKSCFYLKDSIDKIYLKS